MISNAMIDPMPHWTYSLPLTGELLSKCSPNSVLYLNIHCFSWIISHCFTHQLDKYQSSEMFAIVKQQHSLGSFDIIVVFGIGYFGIDMIDYILQLTVPISNVCNKSLDPIKLRQFPIILWCKMVHAFFSLTRTFYIQKKIEVYPHYILFLYVIKHTHNSPVYI